MFLFSHIFLLCFFELIKNTFSCPLDAEYYPNSPYCFKFMTQPYGFLEADDECVKLGGHLASVDDAFMGSFIYTKANSYFVTNSYWLGGTTMVNGNWTWTDFAPFSYKNWAVGQPNSTDPAQCLYAKYDGKWYSTNYETQLAFVCKLLEDQNDVGICLDGWTWSAKNHRCYKAIGSRNLSSEYAEKQCYELTKDKFQTAILATIHSEYENRIIHTIASDYDSDFAYIGLWGGKYPNGSISWSWDDGSLVNYTNFSPNAPLVNSSSYDVLMNMNDGTWWLNDPNDNMSNNKTFHNAICMYESNE